MNNSLLKEILPSNDKFIVIDGGARGGPKDLASLNALCQFHCFEPNPAESGSVNNAMVNAIQQASENERIYVYPFALCAESGTATLNISLRPGATSTLEPNGELLRRFAADHFSEMEEIVKRIEVPAISLGEFMTQSKLPHIDFLKLDTQGNELDILKSASEYLDKLSVIMTEVEMIPLYKNQALFHDVSQFLHSHGFELIDIRSTPSCRRFHSRSDLPPSAYRLVWGDAIFARRPDDVNKPRSLQQGLILAALGYADIAIDLFDRNGEVSVEQKRQLEIFARKAAAPYWLTGRIRNVLERTFNVLLQRYNWKKGHQVKSLKIR